MKRIIVTICSILAINSLHAQGIALGVRSGIGNNLDITRLKQDGVKQKYWDKQVFGRYETKGRLALETNVSQYSFSNAYQLPVFGCFAPAEYEAQTSYVRTNNVEVGISAQYDVTCSYLKTHCPLFKNVKSFVGVNVGSIFSNGHSTITGKRISDGNTVENTYKNSNTINIVCGLNHTTIYTFNRLFLTSSVNLMTSPSSFGAFSGLYMRSPEYSNTNLSLKLGVGYKL